MPSIKHRLILGIANQTIARPRQLQQAAETDEHHVVHALYSLQRQGLVEYKRKRNADATGINLTDIKLTKKGLVMYEELTHART
jgi:hypothetical protein